MSCSTTSTSSQGSSSCPFCGTCYRFQYAFLYLLRLSFFFFFCSLILYIPVFFVLILLFVIFLFLLVFSFSFFFFFFSPPISCSLLCSRAMVLYYCRALPLLLLPSLSLLFHPSVSSVYGRHAVMSWYYITAGLALYALDNAIRLSTVVATSVSVVGLTAGVWM